LAIERLNGKQQLTINAILLQNPFKVYFEELVHMLLRDQQCRVVFAIFSRFFEDLLQSEDLVHGAATGMKIALSIHQIWIPLFHSIFLQGNWHTLFLAS